jgi:hypothetical protein
MTTLHDTLRRVLQGYALEEIAVSLPDGEAAEVMVGEAGELWAVQAEGERLVVVLHLVKTNAAEAP